MVKFLEKILGTSWRTKLASIGVFAALIFKCVTGGGQFLECMQEAWSLAFIAGGAGLWVARDAAAK